MVSSPGLRILLLSRFPARGQCRGNRGCCLIVGDGFWRGDTGSPVEPGKEALVGLAGAQVHRCLVVRQ